MSRIPDTFDVQALQRQFRSAVDMLEEIRVKICERAKQLVGEDDKLTCSQYEILVAAYVAGAVVSPVMLETILRRDISDDFRVLVAEGMMAYADNDSGFAPADN